MFICIGKPKHLFGSCLLWYWLCCGVLEPNLQYLQGTPVFLNFCDRNTWREFFVVLITKVEY